MCLGTPALVLTADKISAFFGRLILDAWSLRLACECAQESPCPFQLPLPFGVPPALLLTHQLDDLCSANLVVLKHNYQLQWYAKHYSKTGLGFNKLQL